MILSQATVTSALDFTESFERALGVIGIIGIDNFFFLKKCTRFITFLLNNNEHPQKIKNINKSKKIYIYTINAIACTSLK